MKSTEYIWLDPAAAYAMWIGVWTAWCAAAVIWWFPGPAVRGSPGGVLNGSTGHSQRLRRQDHSNAADYGGAARQAMNGHGAG